MTYNGRFPLLPSSVRTRRLLIQQKELWVREALVDQVSTDTLERWLNYLDEDERWRINRLISGDRRKEAVSAHALLRGLAGEITHLPPEAFRFVRGSTGKKPYLLSDLYHGLDANLTHCTAFAACVVSEECDVGIDAEDLFRSVSASELLPYFAREEQQWLKSLSPSHADRASLQLWSLKEATVKAIGCGLSLDLAEFALLPKPLRLFRAPAILGNATHWRFWQFYPTDRHVLSIAAREREVIA